MKITREKKINLSEQSKIVNKTNKANWENLMSRMGKGAKNSDVKKEGKRR